MGDYIEYTVRVYDNGTKEWYLNAQLHRENGPAVEMADGTSAWYFFGKQHRSDGPAVECPDAKLKEWWVNGNLHKEDGPAIEYENGNKYWFLNGKEVTEEDVMSTSMVGKRLTIDGIQYLLTRENIND